MSEYDVPADFELVFSSTGSVSLVDCDNDRIIWSSDNDQEFAENFDGDFFDASNAGEIIDYLEEQELIDESAILDLVEEDEDGEDDIIEEDDDVIDAEFTPAASTPIARRKNAVAILPLKPGKKS